MRTVIIVILSFYRAASRRRLSSPGLARNNKWKKKKITTSPARLFSVHEYINYDFKYGQRNLTLIEKKKNGNRKDQSRCIVMLGICRPSTRRRCARAISVMSPCSLEFVLCIRHGMQIMFVQRIKLINDGQGCIRKEWSENDRNRP